MNGDGFSRPEIRIGIDTSEYGRKIAVAVGLKPDSIYPFLKRVEARLKKEGYSGELHWRRIRTTTRKRILDDLISYLKAARKHGLITYIFQCKREGVKKNWFFLKFCPMKISEQILPHIRSLGHGTVFIISDNDFDSLAPKKGNPTIDFLERLITNIATGLAFTEVRPAHKNDLVCHVGLPKNKLITLVGRKRRHNRHPEIQAADIILGIYNDAKKYNKRLDGIVEVPLSLE